MNKKAYRSTGRTGIKFDVVGEVLGSFGIDNWNRSTSDGRIIGNTGSVWWVTHIPTGNLLFDPEVGGFPTKEQAEYYVDFLNSLRDINWRVGDGNYYDRILIEPDGAGEYKIIEYPSVHQARQGLIELSGEAGPLVEFLLLGYNRIYTNQHLKVEI